MPSTEKQAEERTVSVVDQSLVDELMAGRDRAKKRGDRHADQAIKIMMNSFFGVLGAPACRFFDPEVANAITLFGQQVLHWTEEAFAAAGVSVLYGDTDSVFVDLGEGAEREGPRSYAESLRARIQAEIDDRVRREYGVEPKLTLELPTFTLPRPGPRRFERYCPSSTALT